MKVAVVYHFFAHYRAAVMTELVRHGAHGYLLFGDRSDPAAGRGGGKAIPAWDMPPGIPFVPTKVRRLWGPVLWQRGLLRVALRRDVGCVIFLGSVFYPATWLAAAVARMCGKRVLFWTHGWRRRENGVSGLFRRVFYRLAHGLLLYGERARRIGIESGFDPARLYVVYNSLDYPAQKRLRDEVGGGDPRKKRGEVFPSPERPVVLCCSRLLPARRYDLLLRAVERLKRAGREVNVLVVGDGPERGRLESLAKDLGLDVAFYGPCYSEEELARLYMMSDVTVSPGEVGLTVIHSLTYGVPVVTCDDLDIQKPEVEAIVEGWNGSFFRAGDVSHLAEKLMTWTSPDLDRELVRGRCYETVDTTWNPAHQRRIIDGAAMGARAEDVGASGGHVSTTGDRTRSRETGADRTATA